MSSAPITKNISFDAPRSHSFSVSPNSRYEVKVGVEPAYPCQGTIESKWAAPMTGTCITPASGKWFCNFPLSIFDCDCIFILFFYFYFISIFILLTRRKATEALIHRVGNYPDLLLEIPRYCCPLVI